MTRYRKPWDVTPYTPDADRLAVLARLRASRLFCAELYGPYYATYRALVMRPVVLP